MRWKNPKPSKPPKIGDERGIREFAWKETVVGDYTVWLEYYIILEHYTENGWVEFDKVLSSYR